MSFSKTLLFTLATASSFLCSHALTIERRDGTPNLPYDENTTKECTWWVDYDASSPCEQMLEDNLTNLEDFRRWNPTIGLNCEGLTSGRSYCVEALFETPPPVVTSSTTPTSSTFSIPTSSSSTRPIVSSTSSPSPTPKPSSTTTPMVTPTPSSTTSAGTGIQTPLPTQPDIVSNCDAFYFVKANDQCSDIVTRFGITLDKFLTWNPRAGSNCAGLWASAYACVSIIGDSPASTTTSKSSSSSIASSTTTTSAGNGVATPQPTQPGMVTNCAKFHWITPGDTCDQVLSYEQITLADFARWNPSVGNDCRGMQANVNVCVGIIMGSTPTPTTPPPITLSTKPSPTITTPSNGIATPQPTQPGMIPNCAKFHYIAPGSTCDQVLSYEHISLADFAKWNPTVGPSCSGMQANVNVCVGLLTTTTTPTPPTTTSAGNGVATPQPTQPGMVSNCKKFHYADTGVQCSQIISYNHISLKEFVAWNAGVGEDCRGMWAKTWTCVGV